MQVRDPEKIRKYVRDHYYRHKARVIAKVRAREKIKMAKHHKILSDYKKERGCANCPENDPVCLQFHHVHGEKEFNISHVLRLSLPRIMAEVEKCIVLCSNCHIKEHSRLKKIEAPVAER